jgi:3-phenylpropionate/trans-cinnamate dioxygenase ferredoxin reductase subunit
MTKSVVIVGAGHAGVQAAASLRDNGYDGSLILLGDEKGLPYHKPPLSKGFMKAERAQPQPLRGESFYRDHHIDYRSDKRVIRIDGKNRSLEIAGDKEILFDHLILATGSRNRPLTAAVAHPDGVFSLRSLADASALREQSSKSGDIVIIGGGFIGLELSATLATGDRKVTVIEAGPRILGRAVSPAIATSIRQQLEAKGVRILTGTSVASLEGNNGSVKAVVTTEGERLATEFVIVGIGALPNVELAQEAGISVANGIAVDHAMRTSIPEVLAIGDVASYRHWLTGEIVRLESVQNATDQARLASRTILGSSEPYRAVPWFWSDIGETKLQIVGLTGRSDRSVKVVKPDQSGFSIYHFFGSELTSVESLNAPADHMLGRKLLDVGYSPSAEILSAGTEEIKKALSRHLAD